MKQNPFEVFELFEPGLEQKTLRQHEALFKDRKEIVQKIYAGVTLGRSYKVVLHGELGVGKSSILNRILYLLQKDNYFVIKYRVSATVRNTKDFEREFLRTFGEAIAREARRNAGLLNAIRTLFEHETKKGLEEIALLAILYASELITVTNRRVAGEGLSITVGIPLLKGEVTEQEQEQIQVARTETLSHSVFVDLLGKGISFLKKLGYRGVVIGLDEIDKLDDVSLEKALMTLLKDVFYTYGSLSHLIVVMKGRDGLKPVHPDVFHYERVLPLAQEHVLEFVSQLYRAAAVDPRIPLDNVIDRQLLLKIYRDRRGRIRFILEDLSDALLSALQYEGTQRIDEKVYNKVASEPVQTYLRTLKPTDVEYQILHYLLGKKSTYSRDKDLSRTTGLKKSALAYRLEALRERGILATMNEGKTKLYYIEPGLRPIIDGII